MGIRMLCMGIRLLFPLCSIEYLIGLTSFPVGVYDFVYFDDNPHFQTVVVIWNCTQRIQIFYLLLSKLKNKWLYIINKVLGHFHPKNIYIFGMEISISNLVFSSQWVSGASSVPRSVLPLLSFLLSAHSLLVVILYQSDLRPHSIDLWPQLLKYS